MKDKGILVYYWYETHEYLRYTSQFDLEEFSTLKQGSPTFVQTLNFGDIKLQLWLTKQNLYITNFDELVIPFLKTDKQLRWLGIIQTRRRFSLG